MNRKAFLGVMLVFVLGVATGAMGFYLSQVRAGVGGRPTVVERLTNELSLTPLQQQQVTAVLEETKKSYDSILNPVRPQMEAVRHDGRQKIRAILSADQLPKFEEHLRRIDEERAKRK